MTTLKQDAAKAINARRVESLEDLVAQCDVITIVSSKDNGADLELSFARANERLVQQGSHFEDEEGFLVGQHRARCNCRSKRCEGSS